ncbi:hypothetical protein EG68_12010 [Paragonimus skrjabini miyazakii]|uniref:PH domain-containing protein n=1 Tax=Paragonimus skrjabini miyazakii TaxID=59628 RepID=A0A8S9YIW1_9TREM|nr:hypothetical protein EG68_12010 [Paragonimus skrjabini miyazakii]
MSSEIVKAGRVQRLSTVLKRWKPAWIVVYATGGFGYFESENSYVPKATVHLPTQCVRLISNPVSLIFWHFFA